MKSTVKNLNEPQNFEILQKIASLKAKADAYIKSREMQPITENMYRAMFQCFSPLEYKKQFVREEDLQSFISNRQS